MARTRRAKIVTVTSMKGGVGKTSTILGMAAIYSNRKKKVLIIDLDLYTGSVVFALNVKPKTTIYNLYDDIVYHRIKESIGENYLTKYNDYIFVLAAPIDPRDAHKIDENYLEVIINAYTIDFDVILIDTAHVLSRANRAAFEQSDLILTLFSNNPLDLKNTKTFMAICHNMEMDNIKLVLNNAINMDKESFTLYDIKNVVKSKIEYVINSSFNIKNYTRTIMDGKIINAYIGMLKTANKDYVIYEKALLNLLDKEGE